MLTAPLPTTLRGTVLYGPPRAADEGSWWRTDTGSVLRLAQQPASTAAVAALRSLGLPGVWPIVGLVDEPDSTWLVTEAPLSPTLGDLLNSEAELTPLDAAGLVNEVGQTLLALRRAGWWHTALTAASVVVGADGIARLRDAAVLARPVAGEQDRADIDAWAALVQAVGAAWSGTAEDEFAEVAEVARTEGLARGLSRLGAAARALPAEGERRSSVRAAVAASVALPAALTGATRLARRATSSEKSPARPGLPGARRAQRRARHRPRRPERTRRSDSVPASLPSRLRAHRRPASSRSRRPTGYAGAWGGLHTSSSSPHSPRCCGGGCIGTTPWRFPTCGSGRCRRRWAVIKRLNCARRSGPTATTARSNITGCAATAPTAAC